MILTRFGVRTIIGLDLQRNLDRTRHRMADI